MIEAIFLNKGVLGSLGLSNPELPKSRPLLNCERLRLRGRYLRSKGLGFTLTP